MGMGMGMMGISGWVVCVWGGWVGGGLGGRLVGKEQQGPYLVPIYHMTYTIESGTWIVQSDEQYGEKKDSTIQSNKLAGCFWTFRLLNTLLFDIM